jgi:hypothetical protein
MNILLRKSQHSDIQFIRKVLFEAVYWRANDNKPSFQEGLAYPDVLNELVDLGKKMEIQELMQPIIQFRSV